MFKRVFTKIFKGKEAPTTTGGSAPAPFSSKGRTTQKAEPAPAPRPEPRKSEPAKTAPPAKQKSREQSADKIKEQWKAKAAESLNRSATPEEMCGITAGMSREQIQDILTKLYRRHNRAASSLDPKLREEAEFMLEALAGLKEKHLG